MEATKAFKLVGSETSQDIEIVLWQWLGLAWTYRDNFNIILIFLYYVLYYVGFIVINSSVGTRSKYTYNKKCSVFLIDVLVSTRSMITFYQELKSNHSFFLPNRNFMLSQKYASMIWYDMIYIFNCSWVDTRWQWNSRHLHTNNTQNTENGTFITIKHTYIHNNQKIN
jgi:hypothetical protein